MAHRPGRGLGIAALVLLAFGVPVTAGCAAYGATQLTGARVPSDHMRPTYVPGSAAVFRTGGTEPRRGDVVLFDGSAWGDEDRHIERVVAVGGDRISYAAGDETLTLNGQPLDEPYVLGGAPGAGGVSFEVTVPEGRLFLLGDNRGNSADSRFRRAHHEGTVPVTAVLGVSVDEEPLVMAGFPLVSLAGGTTVLVGAGLGIAWLVVRRRKPVPVHPVWGAPHVG
ncbi:signal peptidase I [Streptomyces sp. NBC_01408]|uniref:signal peptidase I n=1 Tax=Streptomyces sp. NBC_01408 TaxID=2903855 RepID=UPI00224FC25B|nr:signal peptidase I [Streptomyces sp. NBC_01408]MCX4693027.1 signal peptidase I [Streptomyces sp. NBC_01408]